jgi:predicted dehydrogenase
MSDLDGMSRREFVADGSRLALGGMIVPRHVLGGPGYQAPSDTLNIAIVGASGMGLSNALEFGTENIVAVCDVDFALVEEKLADRQTNRDGEPQPKAVRFKEQFLGATQYTDFRVMLERQSDLDAVLIATPDHLHAPIAKAAMEMGKHVYVQKPLTSTVHEARVLARVAQETGVVTQMGNQGRSKDSARLIDEWVQAGIVGPVRQVLVWTNRPIWPQGLPSPVLPERLEETPSWGGRTVTEAIQRGLAGDFRPPPGLDWDLYLGPASGDIAYHPMYHPFNWRGWVPFGVGALGDMGAHLIDHPLTALDLGYPTAIESTSTPWGGSQRNPATYPLATAVHYEFPRRGLQPPVRLSWYDGGLMPKRPDALPMDVELNREGGVIYVGERGILMHGTYGQDPQLYPAELQEEAALVPQRYPRIAETHEMNWAMACKGEAEAASPFEYAARLTEVMLLGIVALRAGQGRKILYDADRMEVTNVPEANQYLTREYRTGWEV